jgi:hypothetical protein
MLLLETSTIAIAEHHTHSQRIIHEQCKTKYTLTTTDTKNNNNKLVVSGHYLVTSPQFNDSEYPKRSHAVD